MSLLIYGHFSFVLTVTVEYMVFFFFYRMHAPMIAVGSDDPSPSAGGKCQIYEFNSANRLEENIVIVEYM